MARIVSVVDTKIRLIGYTEGKSGSQPVPLLMVEMDMYYNSLATHAYNMRCTAHCMLLPLKEIPETLYDYYLPADQWRIGAGVDYPLLHGDQRYLPVVYERFVRHLPPGGLRVSAYR